MTDILTAIIIVGMIITIFAWVKNTWKEEEVKEEPTQEKVGSVEEDEKQVTSQVSSGESENEKQPEEIKEEVNHVSPIEEQDKTDLPVLTKDNIEIISISYKQHLGLKSPSNNVDGYKDESVILNLKLEHIKPIHRMIVDILQEVQYSNQFYGKEDLSVVLKDALFEKGIEIPNLPTKFDITTKVSHNSDNITTIFKRTFDPELGSIHVVFKVKKGEDNES